MNKLPYFIVWGAPKDKDFPVEIARDAFLQSLSDQQVSWEDAAREFLDLPGGMKHSDTKWAKAEDAAWEACRATGYDTPDFLMDAMISGNAESYAKIDSYTAH